MLLLMMIINLDNYLEDLEIQLIIHKVVGHIGLGE